MVTDLLLADGISREWRHPRRDGNFHGTGCTLSAAIAAGIANGNELEQAIDEAIAYLLQAMDCGSLVGKGKLVLLGNV